MLLVLVLVAGAAAGAWWLGLFTGDDTTAAAPTPTSSARPTAGPSASTNASATPSAVCPTTSAPPAPTAVAVNVYNGTDRAGLAAQVATTLKARGFLVGKVANDPLGKKVSGTAEIRAATDSPAAITVAAQVPGSRLVADTRRDNTVDLVLGVGYAALGTPSQVSDATRALASIPPGCPG